MRTFLLLAAGLLLGCGQAPEIPNAIGPIVEQPSAYLGETVELEGSVVGPLPSDVGSTYRLHDETGTIAVVSENPAPTVGQRLTVTGVVERDIVVGDMPVEVAIRETARNP